MSQEKKRDSWLEVVAVVVVVVDLTTDTTGTNELFLPTLRI